MELTLTNKTTGFVSIVNIDEVGEPFTNAYASVPLTITGPASITVTTTAIANTPSGIAPPFPPVYDLPGVTNTETGNTVVPLRISATMRAREMFRCPTQSRPASAPYGGSAGPGVYFGEIANAGGSLEVTYTYTLSTIPEPSTWAMVAVGFMGIGFTAFSGQRRNSRYVV